ncbi:hypothetical protein LZP69_08680 [Shewanella sp. AS1]|uniref:hypothetical protein n=1 Tax=Shewanella sp. AS1 TaxID=2907626 RepID=UPI001F259F59|nr:hypothetical protein [Shewanella sp. AS1]MCE9679248.1 hypothetical protein [Shewanella sp. AS1]
MDDFTAFCARNSHPLATTVLQRARMHSPWMVMVAISIIYRFDGAIFFGLDGFFLLLA